MRKVSIIFAALAVLLCRSLSGIAQETTADIQGTVTDGKMGLSGATIVALHTPTGTKYTTTTRKDGRYNLPNLRIGGPYTITVTYVGFKEEKQENVTLVLGQDFKSDFSLSTDSKQLSEVVVAGTRQNKVFNNSRTGSQEIISRTQIDRLPTISRSLQDFTKLTPSANGMSFGGGSSAFNSITLDGANFTNSFGLGTVGGMLGAQTGQTPISLDAVEQIQVNISPFDTRTGGFAGTGINAVTRGGTNQFKGSVYTYIKGSNTQGYKVENTTLPKQVFTYSLRGASLGGPIIKNKLFFFVSGEQLRQTAPASSYTASSASNPAIAGVVSQANYDTLMALASFLQTKLGYNPGAFQGYTYNTQSDKITARIDWNVNSRNTVTLKYNYFKSEADQPPSGSGPSVTGYTSVSRSPGNNAMPFANVGYGINNNFNIVIGELNTRFSNTSSNKFQVGYTAIRDPRSSPSSVFPLVDILKLNPSVGTASTSFGYEQFTYGNIVKTNVFQFSDVFTLYVGAHELTAGTQNYFKDYVNGFAPQFAGLYQFNTLQDFYNSVNSGTGSQFYSRQYSAVPGVDFPYAKSGSRELSLFVQDKWRIRTNFTLLYGLRADNRSFKSSFLQNTYFSALTFNGKSYNTGQKPKDNIAISPRLGFNWDIKNDKSIQVRGGIGLFSGPPPFVWFSNQASNNGALFGQQVSYTPTSPTNTAPTPTGAQPFSGTVNIKAPSTLQVPTTYVVNVTDPNFKYPSVLKSTLAIDKKLPGDLILTLEGTYSKDVNSVYFQNINLPQSGATNITNGLDTRQRYPSPNNLYPGSGAVSATNPKLTSVILMTNSSKGYSYTATLQLQKTFKNLYLNGAYTYSKSINTNELGTTAASLWGGRPILDNPNSDATGYASYYQPHRVIFSASYRFEYAKHFATSFGLIFEAANSGTTSYVYSGDLNNDGQTGNELIYIPRTQSDINLVKVNSGGLGTGTTGVTDTRTAGQIWAQLNNYINQDRYLANHRGKIADRNAVVFPMFKRADLNITQDIYFYTKNGGDRDKHTLRLTLDVLNLGNFINKNWGIYKFSTLTPVNGSVQLLKYEGLAADGKTPSFSFPYQDAGNQVPVTNSFTNNTGITSRWQMQFGIRYLFN